MTLATMLLCLSIAVTTSGALMTTINAGVKRARDREARRNAEFNARIDAMWDQSKPKLVPPPPPEVKLCWCDLCEQIKPEDQFDWYETIYRCMDCLCVRDNGFDECECKRCIAQWLAAETAHKAWLVEAEEHERLRKRDDQIAWLNAESQHREDQYWIKRAAAEEERAKRMSRTTSSVEYDARGRKVIPPKGDGDPWVPGFVETEGIMSHRQMQDAAYRAVKIEAKSDGDTTYHYEDGSMDVFGANGVLVFSMDEREPIEYVHKRVKPIGHVGGRNCKCKDCYRQRTIAKFPALNRGDLWY